MACALLTFASSKETINYARLCRLLVDVGSEALRDIFDQIHPPSTLHGALLRYKPILEPLYTGRIGKKIVRKVLNPTQWGKLYPLHSRVTSASFDVTLLVVLLRNICGFSPPATGWDDLPPSTDTSTADDIARVKYYRNTVYSHANQASVDDVTFNTYWREIREALVRLGGPSFRGYIDKLEHDTMDPDMEEHYRELMKQWKKDDDVIKDKLEEVIGEMRGMKKELYHLMQMMTASLKENKDDKDEEKLGDKLLEMIPSEIKVLKDRMDILTSSLEENKDEENATEKFQQVEDQLKNVGEKLDALMAPKEEMKDEENKTEKLEQMEKQMKNVIEKLDVIIAADQSRALLARDDSGQSATGSISMVQDHEIAIRSTEGGSGSTGVQSLMNANINPLGTGPTAAVFAGANINTITNCSFHIVHGVRDVKFVQNGTKSQVIQTGEQDD